MVMFVLMFVCSGPDCDVWVVFVCSGPEPGAPQALIPRGGPAVHRGVDPAASEHALSGPATHCAGCGRECSYDGNTTHIITVSMQQL